MSIRNLDALFEPKSIALIGASNQSGSVGSVLARNLFETGFQGVIMAVNPHERVIRSTLAYASVAALPEAPDLAVIATPPATVPGLITELGARGCRAAVVITAGFGEAGGGGADLKAQMLAAARPHLLRIVGPNCLGVISPGRGINASFAQLTPPSGGLALIAQSGAVTTAALDWASARGYGFSRIVTLGDMADVDFGDVLDYLAADADTHAIVLYVEAITQARKFMSAARVAGRTKPVVVIKAGRSAAGAKAALSHTGALAGSDAVYDAAFRRAGLLRVGDLRELFDAVSTLTSSLKVQGDRLAVLSNGGGAGVMAVDALDALGGRLATLSAETIAALGAVLPAAWSKANPVDIIGDAGPDRYSSALERLLADPGADAVLVLNCPTAVADSTAAARAVIETVAAHSTKRPVLTAWLGETSVMAGRQLLTQAGLPTHETPDEAVRAFMHLADHARNQALLMQAPADEGPPMGEAARAVVERVRAEGRALLNDMEAKAVLSAYGIPVVATLTAATPKEAGDLAEGLSVPVALKILSPDITHKSDAGGVALGLSGRAAVETAARQMLDRIGQALPAARLDGFMIQAMVDRPGAHELIAGIAQDPTFGPVVLFGAGGTAVEVIGDRSLGLTPLNTHLALDMIDRTRVSKLLAGYRDRPAADRGAIANVLVRLSRMATDLDGLLELDINPLLADDRGVLAVDARIRLALAGEATVASAIAPYPADLVGELLLPDGAKVPIRPVRPDDAPRLRQLVDRSDAEDVRFRFGSAFKPLPAVWATRLSQIDYDREMALVATDLAGEIMGVARLVADPDGYAAEFALMVRTDQQRHGLGRALLGRLIAHGKGRGLQQIWGQIDRANDPMRAIAEDLGFLIGPSEDFHVVRAVKTFR